MAAYQNSILLPADHISKYAQEAPDKVFIKGVIADDPVTVETVYKKEKTTFTLQAQGLGLLRRASGGARNDGSSNDGKCDWRKVTGLVMVNLYSDKKPALGFSDEVILEGTLSKITGL